MVSTVDKGGNRLGVLADDCPNGRVRGGKRTPHCDKCKSPSTVPGPKPDKATRDGDTRCCHDASQPPKLMRKVATIPVAANAKQARRTATSVANLTSEWM